MVHKLDIKLKVELWPSVLPRSGFVLCESIRLVQNNHIRLRLGHQMDIAARL